MAIGRPRKPDALKSKLGTLQPCRARTPLAVMPSTGGIPRAPRGLKTEGRRAWRVFWQLGEPWLSPRTDAKLIERLCRAYDEEAELTAALAKTSPVLKTEQGAVVANPLVGQLRKLQELILRMEGLCGFTPSDRSRLGMAEVQRVSKLDQILRNRGAG
ncbi:MAG: phage terminase small subunit P27 family [Chloroflexi bacterium]|nr:phage terminase small subunit P27 family [Chloroflexota bacterium]